MVGSVPWMVLYRATNGDSMGTGKRAESRRQKFRGATEALAGAPLHVFQNGLNTPLAEVRFDHSVESICEAH